MYGPEHDSYGMYQSFQKDDTILAQRETINDLEKKVETLEARVDELLSYNNEQVQKRRDLEDLLREFIDFMQKARSRDISKLVIIRHIETEAKRALNEVHQ